MTTQARIVWDDSFTGYDFGEGHPMNPIRLDLTARLCRGFGLFDSECEIVAPDTPDDSVLARVHSPEYIDAVKHASVEPGRADSRFGLGTEDDPAFEGIHDVSARIAEGSRAVAEGVWRGEVAHGVNFTGGLHHAMPGSAAGFCIYNDAGVAIDWLLEQGVERIAYVDVDAHHGDGVERMFWDDPRVLTISIHETGTVLFPGTGFPGDLGGPGALGSAVNLALPPGVGDAGWLRAFHAVAPAVLRAFRPQIIVSQHGADSHFRDPLAHLSVSVDAQRILAESLHDLSHELCDGRWVALGGGGYEVVSVVPRTWTHLTAVALHRPIPVDTAVPQGWLDDVTERLGEQAPEKMGDGASEDGRIWWRSWEVGYDPEDPVDRATMKTREAVFPHHGLDLWFD
ncbi:acetoin utilization protein AcuC [Mobilicoccus pelagius]|uniref:Acetoin utilization protein AcuC n=1 Tax=Mobilicoccus pelagius NBRC 104925 TaxID=1089455 RepID=H5US35_9MICO|nr:acetoin utilization protein AcuC [Mobilicoccus pelagius]GAB48543.1 putative deacetylase [Mobilicoccus pelagius NBRC 104925]